MQQMAYIADLALQNSLITKERQQFNSSSTPTLGWQQMHHGQKCDKVQGIN